MEAIITSISLGLPDKTAYEAAGVSASAFYRSIELGTDDPDATPPRKARSPYREFAEKVSRARAQFTRNHVATVTASAQGTVIEHYGPDGKLTHIERRNDGDWRASKWLLSVRRPEDFSERHVIEQLHTPQPVPDRHADLDGMSPEELEAEAIRVRAAAVAAAVAASGDKPGKA